MDTRCRLPCPTGQSAARSPVSSALMPSRAHNKGQSLILQKANAIVHCVLQGDLTTVGWVSSETGSEGGNSGST